MAGAQKPPEMLDPGDESLPNDPGLLRQKVQNLFRDLQRAQLRIESLESALKSKGSPAEVPVESDRERKLLAEQLERQAMLLERDEQVARELQRSLRPVMDEELEGVRFAIETKPGTRVGGDFYDIINLSDNFVAFLIADVSGYGLPAAVIMATGRLAFRTYATDELSPRKIMDNVNRAMLRSTLAGHYMTAFLCVLDTELLTLQFVNASHCTPFVIRNGEVLPLDTEGLFVGMFEDGQYEEKGLQLEQNDRLFLYTDGLLKGFEARDRKASERKLQSYLKDSGQLGIEELVGRLGSLMEMPEDDVALLGAEVLLEKAQRKTIAISSVPGQLTHVESAILPVLDNKGYGERNIFGVKLALEEAVINAIKHGNELDDTKKVTVSFYAGDDRVIISVADEGAGFDPADVPDPTTQDNLLASSGRGIALMRAYMDEVRFNEKGNEITLIKYAPWAAAKRT
ncbi:MAG: serine/threonine-protein phosphatase [Candidatus Brocadiaceae bacterium]|jgi:serine phosphatase RsbU (regulator of sigma subunit)/anti-sigma regulatory factor (Ser/Thr protein kinase)